MLFRHLVILLLLTPLAVAAQERPLTDDDLAELFDRQAEAGIRLAEAETDEQVRAALQANLEVLREMQVDLGRQVDWIVQELGPVLESIEAAGDADDEQFELMLQLRQIEAATQVIQRQIGRFEVRLAQADPQGLVRQLDDPDFAVRELAEHYLLTSNELDMEALAGLMALAESYEQRCRLLRVAEHHVMRLARQRDFELRGGGPDIADNGIRPATAGQAAIGYTYSVLPASQNAYGPDAGVVVTTTMPGFPAFSHLRAGDIILALDGRSLPDTLADAHIVTWINTVTAAYRPGDVVAFDIIRDGQAQTIQVPCAQKAALTQMYLTDALKSAVRIGVYDQEWFEARRRLTVDLPTRPVLTVRN